MIKIGVIDDYTLFRKSLILLINTFKDMSVIWDTQNGTDAVAKQRRNAADVILMDMGIAGTAQAETTKALKEKFPDAKILTLSGLTVNDRLNAIEELAPYSFFKNTGAVQLEKSIIDLHTKEKAADKASLKTGINNMPLPGTALSKREIEIIKMAGKEFNSGEIAAKLDINVRTVETHRKRIMAKTNCKNFIGVVVFALKNNYIQIEDFS